MKPLKLQAILFRLKNTIHRNYNPIIFDAWAKKYYKKLWYLFRKNILNLSWFLLAITGIELLLPLMGDRLIEQVSYRFNPTSLLIALGVLFLILVLYLFLNFHSIRLRKQITLDIINRIREDWVKRYLDRQPLALSVNDQSNLYVKLSYHLSLLQLGIASSFLVVIEWVILFFGILAVTAILDTRLLMISLAFVPVHLVILFVGYYFSAYYLAQDQTLYSRLMRSIVNTFNSFPLTKALRRETVFLKEFRQTVNLDTYFRVRREIVLRLGPKIIFAVLTLLSAFVYFINLYLPLSELWSDLGPVIHTLVFVLHLKLIYLSLNLGLYTFPLKLGAYLCLPEKPAKKGTVSSVPLLELRASKVRLRKIEPYQKNIRLLFQRGTTNLVSAEDVDVNLSQLFAGGVAKRDGMPWIVVIGKRRFLYDQWAKAKKSLYYMNPFMTGSISWYEYFGENYNASIFENPVFAKLWNERSLLSVPMNLSSLGVIKTSLIQIAHIIITKPSVVVVDASIADLAYPEITIGIKLLRQELPETIIIVVSNKLVSESSIAFDSIYQL